MRFDALPGPGMQDTLALVHESRPRACRPVQYPAYDPQSSVTPLSPEEMQSLDLLLQRLDTEEVMSLDGMDGYLTALAIGPAALRALPTGDWLPAIWGGDSDSNSDSGDEAAPFNSKRQRKNTVVLALRHLRHLQQQLHQSPDDWEPIFSIAEKGDEEWADAREWCMGFLQAVDLLPSAWGSVWTAPPLAGVLRPLLLLGGGLDDAPLERLAPGPGEDTSDLAGCDAMSRAVPEAVLQLMAAVHSNPSSNSNPGPNPDQQGPLT